MTEWYEWRDLPRADYAVIGDPVSHSKSPDMQNAAFKSRGLPSQYVAVRVPQDDFVPAIRALEHAGYVGLNVTVPLKEAAYDWADGGDSRIGATNTIRIEDRQSINTDAPGFLSTLRDLAIEPCQVLVLGAGGTSRSLCVALCDAGFEVAVFNRNQERARQLKDQSRCPIELLVSPDPKGRSLIVNATSASLKNECPDLVWANLDPEAFAYDVMYGERTSPFLSKAAEHGLRSCDGLPLLLAQGALSFEWWTGLEAPIEEMKQALA